MDNGGKVFSLPIGTIHFLEHVIFRQKHKILSSLEHSFGANVNAVVAESHTVWYAKHALVEGDFSKGVSSILRTLLAAILDLSESRVEAQHVLDHIRSEIQAEIVHLQARSDYQWHRRLLEAMYVCHPVRHDPLGTRRDIEFIRSEHISRAWELLRNQVYSVNVISSTLNAPLIDGVCKALEEIVEIVPRRQLTPVKSEAETSQLAYDYVKIKFNGHGAYNYVGLKMPPLNTLRVESMERMRLFLIEFLSQTVLKKFGGFSWPHARAYVGWYKADKDIFSPIKSDRHRIIQQFRHSVTRAFVLGSRLAGKRLLAELSEDDMTVASLCAAADLFRFNLAELLWETLHIGSVEADTLAAEVRHIDDNATFLHVGPCCDELFE